MILSGIVCVGQPSASKLYCLPEAQFDTIAYYAIKYHSCDTTLRTHLQAITALQISDHEKGRLIDLQSSQLENYRLLDANWSARLTNQNELFQIQREKDRQKIKKRNRIIVGEGLGILLLLALILL